jgi:polar amino acid transport system permease protein
MLTARRSALLQRTLVTVAVVGGVLLFLALSGPRNGWDFARVWGRRGDADPLGVFLRALLLTVEISAAALGLALVFGFLGGLARLSARPWLHQLGSIYVEVVRGTPLLVQLFVAVYCVGYALGIDEPLAVGVLTLGLFAGAYVTEVFRGAVESVDPGQTEAALAQGMTRWQVLRHVLLPQALRRMLPPLAGELASLVKDSSLLSAVGVLEVTKRAREFQAETYRTFEVFLPLAVTYLAITFPLSRLARRLELRSAGP